MRNCCAKTSTWLVSGEAAGRRLLASSLPYLACLIALSLSLSMNLASQADSKPGKDFFSEPEKKAPGFNGPRLSDADRENRQIPDIRLVRTLPGLAPDTRKQINELYKTWQNETADLRNQLQSTQRQIAKMNEAQTQAKPPSQSAPQGKMPDGVSSMDSQKLPSSDTKVEPESSAKTLSQLKQEQKDVRNEMSAKRKELWEKIRPLLTDQNLADLEKMRKGEFMPGMTTASEVKNK